MRDFHYLRPMRIVEKQCSYGPARAFEGAPHRLLLLAPGDRVLPAPYVGSGRQFTLLRVTVPGEDPAEPHGSITAQSGIVRHGFDLDQVVLWEEGLEESLTGRPARRPSTKKSRK